MNRFCSLFSQILKFIPRVEFEGEVRRLNAERHARGVSCWQQFVSMLFCQLGRAHSLREIEQGLRSCEGKLSHLGIEVLGRSSLSYVNEHRPWQLYQNVFHVLFARFQSQLALPGTKRTKKFRFKNKLVSVDSSVIDLCLKMYDWAKFRTTKGAIKLHLLLDHDGYLPSFAVITTGKVHDVTVARTLKLQPGTIIVDDRGYNDYELFGRWTLEGVYFVTRLKDNAVYRVAKNLPVPDRASAAVKQDQIIRLTPPTSEDQMPARAAAGELPRYRAKSAVSVPDQQLQAGTEAKSEDQDVRGHLAERGENPGMDGADCHVDVALYAAEGEVGLVAIESGGAAADESVHAPRVGGLARQSVCDAARTCRAATARHRVLTWIACRGAGSVQWQNPSNYAGKIVASTPDSG